MTDQQSYHDAGGNAHLIVHRDRIEGLILRSQVDLPDSTPIVVAVPPAKLLAMIDTIAPDAIRAYFRETAPEVIADLYRPEIPDAAEQLGRYVVEIPEADSPEDVDEHPDPVTFEWEDPPALNSPGSRPAQYWIGITIMLRSRRGAWAKVGENVNPDSYRRQLRARGCEVTTRNRRNGNRCDVYARFPRSGGAR